MIGASMIPSSARARRGDERRQAERFASRQQLNCQIIDPLDESVAPAGVRNISTSGACVVIEPHYPPGSHIELAIHTPREGSVIRRFAQVVYTLQIPSVREMWLTGCSFCGEPTAEGNS
jgi:hypothetical protein